MYSSLLGGTAKTMSNKTPKTPFSALLSKEEKHFPAGYTDPEGHKGGQFAPKDTTGEVAQETKEKPFVYSDGQTSLVNSMAVNKPKEPTAPDVSPEDLIAHHKAGLEKSAKLLNQYIKQDGGKPTDTNAKILAGNIANHVDALSDLGGMSKEELAKGLSTQGLSMWLKKKHGLPLTAQEEKNIASTMKSAIALQNKKQAAKKLEDHKKNSALAEEAKVKFGEDSAQYKKLKNKAEKDLNKAMSYGVLPADAVKEKEVVKENHDAEKVAQLKAIHDAAEELAHQEHMGTQNTAYYNAVSDAVAAAKYADENETNKAIEAGKATNAAKIANGKTLLSISVIAHAQVQHQQHEAKDSDAYKEYKDAANAYKYYYNTGAIYNGLNKDDLKQAVKTGKLAFSSMKANKNMGKVAPPDVPGFEKLAPAPKPAVEVKPESPKTFSDISSEAKAKDGLQQLVDLTTSYNAHMTMPNNQTYYSDFLEAKKNFDTTMGVGYSDKALAAYYALKNNLVDSQAKDKEAEKEAQKKDFFGGLDYLKAYPNDKEASAKLADNHKEINDTYGAGTTLAWLKEYNAKNKQVEPKTFSDFVNDAKGKGNTGKLAYMTNAYSDHKAAPTPDTQAMLNGAKASLDASMGAGYSDKAIAAYDTATTAKPLATSPDGMMLAKDKSDYFKAIDSTPDSPKGEADPKLMQMKLDIDKKYGDGTANSWIAEKIKGMHADNAAVKESVKASYLSILSYANPDASQQSAIAEMKKNIDAKYGDGTATQWMVDDLKAKGNAATTPETKPSFVDPTVVSPEKKEFFKKLNDLNNKGEPLHGFGIGNPWLKEYQDAKDKQYKASEALDAALKDKTLTKPAVQKLFFDALGHPDITPLKGEIVTQMTDAIDDVYGNGEGNSWLGNYVASYQQKATKDKEAKKDTPTKYVYGKKNYSTYDIKSDALAALRIPHTLDDKSDLIQNIIDKAKQDIDLVAGVKDAGLKYLNVYYTDHSNDNPNPEFSGYAKGVATKMLAEAQEKVDKLTDPVLSLSKASASKKLSDLKQDVDKYFGQGASADLLDAYDEAKAEHKKDFFAKMDAVQGGKANAGNALALGTKINTVDELFGNGTSTQWADEFNTAKEKAKPVDQKAEDKKKYINSHIANLLPEHKPIQKVMEAKYGVAAVMSWVKDFDADRKMLQDKNQAYLDSPSPESYNALKSTKKTIDEAYGDGAADYCLTGHKPDALGSKPKPSKDDEAADKKKYIGLYTTGHPNDFDAFEGVVSAKYGDAKGEQWLKDYSTDTLLVKDAQAKYTLDPSAMNKLALATMKAKIDEAYGDGAANSILVSSKLVTPPAKPKPTQEDKDYLLAASDTLAATGAKVADAVDFAKKVKMFNSIYGEGAASAYIKEAKNLKIPNDMDVSGVNGTTPLAWKEIIKDNYDSSVSSLVFHSSDVEDYPQLSNVDKSYGTGMHQYWLTQHIESLDKEAKTTAPTPTTSSPTQALLDAGNKLGASGAKIRDMIIFASKVTEYNNLYGEGYASKHLADTDSLVIPSDDTVDQNGKTAAECKKSLGDSYDAAVKNAYATNQAIPVYAKTANASFGLATYNYWLAQHIEQLAQGKSSPAPITPVDPKAVKAATAKMKKSVLAAAKALIANPTSPQHAAAFSSLLSDADAKYGSGTALKWIGAANKKEAKANTGTVAALEMPKELNDVIAVGDSVNTASKTQVPKLPDVLPTDKTEAEALNEKLGLAYYTIRHENGGDKNAPDVLASYKVWDTLKDHMKANLGYDKSFFSSSSSDLNSKAQSLWDNSGQAAADKKAKATSDYVDSVAAWSAEASKKNIDPDNEDYLKDMMVTNAKQAVIAGVPSNTIGTLFESGKANSAAFVKKQKDDAMKEIAAASHDYFMKSGLKGEDDPETKAANMNALNIMAKHSMLLSEAEKIDAFGRSKGAAEKTVANMKLLGDLGAAAQKYDSGEINCKWAPKGSDEFNQAKAVGDALWKSLTPSQRSAFTSYTGSGHKGVNKNLAQGTTTDLADVLSKAMDGQSLGVDVKLGRNMPQKWFWKAMGLPNDTSAEMNNLTDEQLQACVGKVYHEPGISSTSYDQDCGVSVTNTGDESGYLKLHIRAAKDISQGLWIDTHSTCSSEREVMLNKGATYLIRGIQRNDTSSYGPYSYTIDLDLIGYTQEPKK